MVLGVLYMSTWGCQVQHERPGMFRGSVQGTLPGNRAVDPGNPGRPERRCLPHSSRTPYGFHDKGACPKSKVIFHNPPVSLHDCWREVTILFNSFQALRAGESKSKTVEQIHTSIAKVSSTYCFWVRSQSYFCFTLPKGKPFTAMG